MGDWEIDVDEDRNRLSLTLRGKLEPSTAEAAADATLEAAERLDDGFDMINDLSEFQPSSEAAMKQIERGKRGIAKRGVAAVVRVTAESTTGQMQWDRAGQEEEAYELAKADSVEKAEKLLERRRQRS